MALCVINLSNRFGPKVSYSMTPDLDERVSTTISCHELTSYQTPRKLWRYVGLLISLVDFWFPSSVLLFPTLAQSKPSGLVLVSDDLFTKA